MRKEKMTFERATINSKFDFCKNFKWFIILPIFLLIAGIVLVSTLGFNLGMDLGGYTSIIVASNSDKTLEDVKSYDLDKRSDFDEFASRISNAINPILSKNGVKTSGKMFRKTTIDVNFLTEDAVEVQIKYTNSDKTAFFEDLQAELQQEFGYTAENNWLGAVSIPKIVMPTQDNWMLLGCLISVLVALVLASIYLAIRFDWASAIAVVFGVFHDILIMLALTLVCRVEISTSIVAIVVAIMLYSLYNHMTTFTRVRENRKSGLYEEKSLHENNYDIANASVKQTLRRSVFTTTFLLVALGLAGLVGIAVDSVGLFVIPCIFGVIISFYSSTFLTTPLWAISYRSKKKKAAK